MNNNLRIYNAVKSVPENAQKEIKGGRLKGKTDINPMWRIKALTEQFGACGIGWKPEIVKCWTEQGSDGQMAAFMQINLYVKQDGKWSDAIPGIGGNMFIEKESKGPYTNDECFKMAYTDAISVACKALGFGADIYWEGDRTKYDKPPQTEPTRLSPKQIVRLHAIAKSAGVTEDEVKGTCYKLYGVKFLDHLTQTQYDEVCARLEKKAGETNA